MSTLTPIWADDLSLHVRHGKIKKNYSKSSRFHHNRCHFHSLTVSNVRATQGNVGTEEVILYSQYIGSTFDLSQFIVLYPH